MCRGLRTIQELEDVAWPEQMQTNGLESGTTSDI